MQTILAWIGGLTCYWFLATAAMAFWFRTGLGVRLPFRYHLVNLHITIPFFARYVDDQDTARAAVQQFLSQIER